MILSFRRVMSPNDADGMANSVDPDQTAPLGAVWSGSALFAQACLSENLGSLRYWLYCHCCSRMTYTSLKPTEWKKNKILLHEGKWISFGVGNFSGVVWCQQTKSFEPRHEKTCFSHMQTTKVQISLRIHAVWSAPLLFATQIVIIV